MRWRGADRTAAAPGSTARSRWDTGGWRSSTCRNVPRSPCAMTRPGLRWSSMAPSTTTRSCAEELQALGHHFVSDGDTEVILRAYAQWGEDCPTRLHGMFAFAIWDSRRQQLFLARDRFGIKPLYYSFTRQGIRFASTSQALLAAGGLDTAIDPVALHHHFTLHAVVPAPRTLLRGLRKLAPGHSLTVTPQAAQDAAPLLVARCRALPPAVHRMGVDRGDTRNPEAGDQETPRDCGCAGRRAAVRRSGLQPAGGVAGRGRRAASC